MSRDIVHISKTHVVCVFNSRVTNRQMFWCTDKASQKVVSLQLSSRRTGRKTNIVGQTDRLDEEKSQYDIVTYCYTRRCAFNWYDIKEWPKSFIFSCVHATLQPALSVRRSVGHVLLFLWFNSLISLLLRHLGKCQWNNKAAGLISRSMKVERYML